MNKKAELERWLKERFNRKEEMISATIPYMAKKRLFGRDLSDTAFSVERLIIWGLQINLLILISGILYLAATEKDIVPLGTLAGTIVGYFIGKKNANKE